MTKGLKQEDQCLALTLQWQFSLGLEEISEKPDWRH